MGNDLNSNNNIEKVLVQKESIDIPYIRKEIRQLAIG